MYRVSCFPSTDVLFIFLGEIDNGHNRALVVFIENLFLSVFSSLEIRFHSSTSYIILRN